jgi:NAD(P)-dependent dehydrogenase (short-subunit alcohol dehydrogenase family)
MNTQNSVVFITGANRGLGLAFAQEALRRGAKKIYAEVRSPTKANTPGIVQVKVDVTDPASIAAAAAQCSDTTVLGNNAGIGRLTSSTLDSAMIDGAREVFETNFYGTILVSQAFAPILAKNGGGAIINVLSDACWLAGPLLAAYSASKSAVWSFTNALRIELRNQKTLGARPPCQFHGDRYDQRLRDEEDQSTAGRRSRPDRHRVEQGRSARGRFHQGS